LRTRESTLDTRRDQGAALIIVLVVLVALLGIGTLTLLSIRAEMVSAGQGRVDQSALYAAESGASAGVEYLRSHCQPAPDFFSSLMSASNATPQSPVDIPGNNAQPGSAGNPFLLDSAMWYQVSVLNNTDDTGFAAGTDTDAVVVLRSVGHGPNGTQSIIEVQVMNTQCALTACYKDAAQRNMSASNDANSLCGSAVSGGTARTLVPGGI
jgi:hypothetical protein